jgi:hypothetical protein
MMDKSGVQESAPVWSFLAVTEVWPDIFDLSDWPFARTWPG